MNKDEIFQYLLSHGFTQKDKEYRKDILVARHNEEKNRLEVFYDVGEKLPAYLYYDLIKDFKPNTIDSFFTNLYEAIKTFDEDENKQGSIETAKTP